MDKKLSNQIKIELDEIAGVFSEFQERSQLLCRKECGHCCFKKDIFCSPLELLPLGISLIKEKKAEEIYDLCLESLGERCLLLKVTDEEKGFGFCSQYEYRPYVCRTFGVGSRKNKYGNADLSICKIIKDDNEKTVNDLAGNMKKMEEVPCIEEWKKRLDVLDPGFLEQEYPINKSLSIILEKLLFLETITTN